MMDLLAGRRALDLEEGGREDNCKKIETLVSLGTEAAKKMEVLAEIKEVEERLGQKELELHLEDEEGEPEEVKEVRSKESKGKIWEVEPEDKVEEELEEEEPEEGTR